MRAPLKPVWPSILACLAVLSAPGHADAADRISAADALARAERFIADNGYTSAPPKAVLDPESLEFTGDRDKLLAFRRKSLIPQAIGVRAGARGRAQGWSVAFDYTDGPGKDGVCRVVTMDPDGAHMAVQHVDGIRTYFAGHLPR